MIFEEFLYPTFIAISPVVVLERHQKIIDKYGMVNLLKREEFKRAREMYETARYVIGMTARTNTLYWITPGKKNETPDTYIIWTNGKTRVLCAECVEITQWEIHVKDMWKIIEKKIKKFYPPNFSIVIHIAREANVKSRDFADIHQRLKKYKISAGAIRFWAETKNKKYSDTLLGELYPSDSYTEFQTSHILSKYRSLSQQIIKIDVISKRSRIIFSEKDVDNKLPELPELNK